VATQTLLEPKPCTFQDLRVELAAVVHNDHDRGAPPEDGLRVEQHLHDPLGVSGQSCAGVAGGSRTDLELAAAENVKRVVVGKPDSQSLYEISAFLELKTVWHPIGT